MLSKFKLQTLKQKLWAIVAASFVARVIVFVALPGTPGTLAPDEGMYSFLTKWISDAESADEFPGYGNGIYRQSKAFIIPSVFFFRMGLNELDAIRFVSSLYGLASTLIAGVCIYHLSRREKLKSKNHERLLLGLYLVFAFLPSRFLWSTLGLRESTLEFWVIGSFISLFLLVYSVGANKMLWFLFAASSICMVFNSRPQVGWLLATCLFLTSAFLFFKTGRRIQLFALVAISVGLVFGNLFNNTYSIGEQKSLTPVVMGALDENLDPPNQKIECLYENEVIKVDNIVYKCTKVNRGTRLNGFENPALEIMNNIGGITEAQYKRKVGAESAIQTFPCPFKQETSFGNVLCGLVRAPYMVATFLLRPILFIDTTSSTSYFAAAENLVWALMLFLLIYGSRKASKVFRREANIGYVFFFISYLVGAGSFQGNLGTAFRHKSLILWILLLLLYLIYSQILSQKTEKE